MTHTDCPPAVVFWPSNFVDPCAPLWRQVWLGKQAKRRHLAYALDQSINQTGLLLGRYSDCTLKVAALGPWVVVTAWWLGCLGR